MYQKSFQGNVGSAPKADQAMEDPSGLPSGTKVANKTGETSQYQHDAAIVFGPKTDYVVCIFSQTNYYWGVQGIKQLSSQIYQALN